MNEGKVLERVFKQLRQTEPLVNSPSFARKMAGKHAIIHARRTHKSDYWLWGIFGVIATVIIAMFHPFGIQFDVIVITPVTVILAFICSAGFAYASWHIAEGMP